MEIESARRMLSNRLTYAACAKKKNTLTPAYIKYWNCWVFLNILHVLIYCKRAYFISCIYPYLSNNFQTPGLLSLGLIFEETLETYKRKKKTWKPILKAMCFHCFCQWKLSFELYNWKAMQQHKILHKMRNISVTDSQPANQNIMHCLSQIIAGFPSHFNPFVTF